MLFPLPAIPTISGSLTADLEALPLFGRGCSLLDQKDTAVLIRGCYLPQIPSVAGSLTLDLEHILGSFFEVAQPTQIVTSSTNTSTTLDGKKLGDQKSMLTRLRSSLRPISLAGIEIRSPSTGNKIITLGLRFGLSWLYRTKTATAAVSSELTIKPARADNTITADGALRNISRLTTPESVEINHELIINEATCRPLPLAVDKAQCSPETSPAMPPISTGALYRAAALTYYVLLEARAPSMALTVRRWTHVWVQSRLCCVPSRYVQARKDARLSPTFHVPTVLSVKRPVSQVEQPEQYVGEKKRLLGTTRFLVEIFATSDAEMWSDASMSDVDMQWDEVPTGFSNVLDSRFSTPTSNGHRRIVSIGSDASSSTRTSAGCNRSSPDTTFITNGSSPMVEAGDRGGHRSSAEPSCGYKGGGPQGSHEAQQVFRSTSVMGHETEAGHVLDLGREDEEIQKLKTIICSLQQDGDSFRQQIRELRAENERLKSQLIRAAVELMEIKRKCREMMR